jgi:hypothetical protein
LIEGASQFRKAMVIELMPQLLSPSPRQHVIPHQLACNSNQPAIAKYAKCISLDSAPAHIDGDDAFYHRTTDADVFEDQCSSNVRPATSWHRLTSALVFGFL